MFRLHIVGVVGSLIAFSGLPVRAAEVSATTFEAQVRPIFKTHCFQCHGEEPELQGNLDLRLVRLMKAGGDSGPALQPGKPDDSPIVQRIASGEMPPGKTKLSANDAATIRRWVEQGAKTARPEPQNVAQAEFTEEERNFWSFQPVRRPATPRVKRAAQVATPVDAFLLERLEREGLGFSPEADRTTLVRRAYLDLWGLPPTPEQVDAFVADKRPDAWERLIDALLASPHYGERWGRHWLDVAGYADSDGYGDKDIERPQAYRYRDYVIRSLNDDKPFDVFVQEQLAGDELASQSLGDPSPADVDRVVATGFLRMGPDGTGDPEVDQAVARQEVIAETIKIVSTSLLGLSVGCAQCHSHRFDPISHVDYYRLRALFEPAYDATAWRSPQQRLVSLWNADERRRAEIVEEKLAKLAAERDRSIRRQLSPLLEKNLSTFPAAVRESIGPEIRKAVLERPAMTPATDAQKALFKKYPLLKLTDADLRRSNPKQFADELKVYESQVAAIKAEGPSPNLAHALTEVPGRLPTTHLFLRGDFNQPAQAVDPGELTILTRGSKSVVPVDDPKLPTSGRRLAYARHLTDGRHPLTARVLVNRLWLHHFGRGIVSTPGDFGAQGERPTHPELLDWLADEFVRGGWRIKPLHKLMMTSTAYRQSTLRTRQLDRIDPENRLLGRASIRRLDAETIRDTVLSVAGTLNETMYGPPLPVSPDSVGQVVIGVRVASRDGRVNKLKGGEGDRRSVYVQARRTMPLAMLEAFDAPTMAPNCEARSSSTVAPQSLLLMNNDFVIEQSERFAERVIREVDRDDGQRIRRAWRLALGVEPTDAQQMRAAQFMAEQQARFTDRPRTDAQARFAKDPAGQALASFCQFLISTNAFLYFD